ncbi:MAG TPA: ABC transporter ATP-binding protein [Tepidisphaeraceae bacterium]|jgi:ABC-type lipoprotein export system ATPase subunit|nr:ABC transporter ATP-binding protein [Tepidisphaeraceae bacterium]
MSQAISNPAVSPPGADKTILRAAAVQKFYRSGEETLSILRGVDLNVRTGEFIAIEGRSGSGKSTLLHILAGLDSPNGGTVQFNGVNIVAISDRNLAKIRNREFGFVFQFYHLLPELNVLENTMLSPMIEFSTLGFRARAADLRKRAADLLNQLGLGHRLKHRSSQLSGGERQRVAIARALMNDPKVLFADEPTGNLDFETGRQIMAVLEDLHRRQGQTIIMVTHDRSLALKADRVLILRNGKLERPGGASDTEKVPAPEED